MSTGHPDGGWVLMTPVVIVGAAAWFYILYKVISWLTGWW